jgi:pimeloyl-ACP methyl ester carboxylesterase
MSEMETLFKCAAVLATFTLMGACSSGEEVDTSVQCTADGAVVHRFDTSDGVTLEADFVSSGTTNSPVVVLLHMIPPHHDRTGYPSDFIDALHTKGFDVLNLDRRGAGASDGVAEEAYTGDGGRLDVEAAVQFLQSHACQSDLARLVVVGASNGTTSALDYTVGTEEPRPAALVFLTGGSYTENQNKLAENTSLLSSKPMLFVFSTEERAWSAAFNVEGVSPNWRFDEYGVGDHGTKMFAAAPESVARTAEWMQSALTP